MNGNAPFHLLAYYTNDLASGASNVALGTVTDQAFTRDSTGYFFPENMKLWAAYAGNDAFTAVRLNSPSLRDPFLPYVEPFSLTTLPANIPPIAKFWEMGADLYKNEYLQVQGTRGVVIASDAYALLWVGRARQAIPPGPRRTIQITAAITIAEGAWSLGTITFAETLPSGKYCIVGMNVFGTNLLAARLAFTGGGYRPGVICQGAQGEWVEPAFGRDELGKFGDFLNTVPPQLECFGVGAGASQIGYLDLVKVG